jgi:hypothetical protein
MDFSKMKIFLIFKQIELYIFGWSHIVKASTFSLEEDRRFATLYSWQKKTRYKI